MYAKIEKGQGNIIVKRFMFFFVLSFAISRQFNPKRRVKYQLSGIAFLPWSFFVNDMAKENER